MWWRKEDPPPAGASEAAAAATGTPTSKRSMAVSLLRSAQMRKQLGGRQTTAAAAAAAAPVTEEQEPVMRVSETGSGIEVSFSDENNVILEKERTAAATHGNGDHALVEEEGVVSLQSQLRRCQAVHRVQFRVPAPATTATTTAAAAAALQSSPLQQQATIVEPSLRGFQLRHHRVGLFALDTHPPMPKFDDALFMLRSQEVVDELTCVEQELELLTGEIQALQQDRDDLQTKAIALSTTTLDTALQPADHLQQPPWPDIYRQLQTANHLTHTERTDLQAQRGLCLTVALHDAPARDAFLSKCGITTSLFRQQQQAATNGQTVVELGPDNCRDGGAATAIQHVALLKGSSSSADASSFFISKDKGKAFCWGRLPERLFRRMKNAGYDPKQHASDILYLATGPLGAYYVEFRNGECWWGSVNDDGQFHAICSDPSWDICRVAFGPCNVFHDTNGGRRYVTSWVILGRDGRAAWRNIPARLQSLLENRLADAPACCEVALGSAGSYFVRFVDGTTDYCLSATAAEVCRSLEHQGSSITYMSLHPELSHDFIIRCSKR